MRAVPMLERELERAARSRAFDGYKLLEDATDLVSILRISISTTLKVSSKSYRQNVSLFN
jgi:hypothetical protein